MAASVRIEDEAFGDGRYEHLAALLNSSKYDAMGRMAYLWRQCTQEQIYVLPESLVRVIIDPDLLIEARLGERAEGGIRIKGTTGRIEWLGKLRKNAGKGGKSTRAKWQAKRGPNGLASSPRAEGQMLGPPAPAPAPAPAIHEETLLASAQKDLELTRGSSMPSSSASSSEPTRSALALRNPQVVDATAIPTTKGLEYIPTPADLVEWSAAYPAVDVPQQLRAMRQWCLANPKRLKTPTGVRTFIAGWLNREQNRGGNQRDGPGGFVTRKGREIQAAVASAMADPNMFDP